MNSQKFNESYLALKMTHDILIEIQRNINIASTEFNEFYTDNHGALAAKHLANARSHLSKTITHLNHVLNNID